jgi:hypothetical protein
MASIGKSHPALGAEAAASKAQREAREAAALRENLRRRKQQARARDDAPAEPENAPQDPGCAS